MKPQPLPLEVPVDESIEVRLPVAQSAPIVYASPHSGSRYEPEFLATTRLDPITLRKSEDSFIDEIFGAAPDLGAPLLHALFPRVCLDPNREPYELDPTMFEDELPGHVNTGSFRVAGGIGTIARVVASGSEIYRSKLRFAEAERRVAAYYQPYHEALARLLAETHRRFGCAVLIDCHSMPSIAGPSEEDEGRRRADIVLGNRFGAACAPLLVDRARRLLDGFGYNVVLNTPYAGGYVTQKYGRPDEGLHALQIEINRALYMDEERIERNGGMSTITRHMTALIEALGAVDPAALHPR
jgi:N-formylglutamate amidohydrolase